MLGYHAPPPPRPLAYPSPPPPLPVPFSLISFCDLGLGTVFGGFGCRHLLPHLCGCPGVQVATQGLGTEVVPLPVCVGGVAFSSDIEAPSEH